MSTSPPPPLPGGSAASRGRLVVTIDGPSGSGKSTVSRRVAQRLGLRYLDTGAMYRALTWAVIGAGIDVTDPTALEQALTPDYLDQLGLDIGTDPRRAKVCVNGVDVVVEIRSTAVTTAVSAVSAVPAVRRWLVDRQREIIGAGGIVVEGRDIASTVAPEAAVQVFLTASGEARALRRHRQDAASGGEGAAGSADLAQTQADLARRDDLDSARPVSPLTRAPGAVEVDSTGLGVAEVVSVILARCASAGVEPAAGDSA